LCVARKPSLSTISNSRTVSKNELFDGEVAEFSVDSDDSGEYRAIAANFNYPLSPNRLTGKQRQEERSPSPIRSSTLDTLDRPSLFKSFEEVLTPQGAATTGTGFRRLRGKLLFFLPPCYGLGEATTYIDNSTFIRLHRKHTFVTLVENKSVDIQGISHQIVALEREIGDLNRKAHNMRLEMQSTIDERSSRAVRGEYDLISTQIREKNVEIANLRDHQQRLLRISA